MRFRFIEDHRDTWPVRVSCNALEVSVNGYYAWRGRPQSARATSNRALLADIRRVHEQHRRRYGAPRIHAALRGEGHRVSRGRVATTDSRHGLPVADNLLAQTFLVTRPNEIWLAYITYIPTAEGWLYLAIVLDLCSRKVVEWAMRDHRRQELTIAALTMALQRKRPGRGLIHHSDRGSQYATGEDRDLLKANGIVPSMSRKGNCWERTAQRATVSSAALSAPMES